MIYKSKGQSSLELLMVVGLALVILVPSTILFVNYAQNTATEVSVSQINLIGQRLLNTASEMKGAGSNSWTTLEINFPENVIDMTIFNSVNETDLIILYDTPSGHSELVFFGTRFRLDNGTTSCEGYCSVNVTPGVNSIRVASHSTGVSIKKVS